MRRQTIQGNSPYEPVIGYARAVRVGPLIVVAGTTGTDDQGHIVGPGDAYAQAVQAIRNIDRALHAVGASLTQVVRTRLYLTNIDDWQAVGRAHGEAFRGIRPVATMVQVARLIDPAMLVEIEADAYASDAPPGSAH